MARTLTRLLPVFAWIAILMMIAPVYAQDQPAAPGMITYTLPDGTLYRIAAEEGAAPENVSALLDALAVGTEDEWLNISPDGEWVLISTDRFDPACVGWPCLALLPADLSAAESIMINGEPVHASSGFGAVASGGNLIVYPVNNGPHALDLAAISREPGGVWSGPVILTEGAAYEWNAQPALSADGRHVIFDCGAEPYGAEGTAICEARTDGSSFGVLIKPESVPGMNPTALHHADYAPDGAIIFESSWDDTERLWRWSSDLDQPELITDAFGNDNSPCVLSDGRIVSLWLGHEDNPNGYHEIKLMSPDAGEWFMLVTGVDVLDVGIGCGG